MKVTEMVKQLTPTERKEAERYLKSGAVKSIKLFQDPLDGSEFEGFIEYDGRPAVLLPGLEVDESMNVENIHCQCEKRDTMCAHKAALLVGVQWMLDSKRMDLKEAMQALGIEEDPPQENIAH